MELEILSMLHLRLFNNEVTVFRYMLIRKLPFAKLNLMNCEKGTIMLILVMVEVNKKW